MIDLVVHAPSKLALEQWMAARGFGTLVQDVDPSSSTFGDWIYTNDQSRSFFYYWRHPSGKLEASKDDTDPENVIVTFYNGFYATLRFVEAIPPELQTWVETSTATSILEGFNGVGGEGVTILNPEDIEAHLASIGVPSHEFAGGMTWSDPALWAFQNVMTGDVRTFDGVDYESLIDFNVWTPTQFPGGWQLYVPVVGEWAPNTSYTVGDEVNYLDITYSCLQSHTSIVGWEPPNVPALWTVKGT